MKRAPLFLDYCRRLSGVSVRAGATGTHWGGGSSCSASLLDSVEDGRNLFALVRLLGSQTTTGDNRCRVTSAQERPGVGRFLRPARNQFFFRKSDFTQAGGGEGKKIDPPKTKRKKEDRGAKNKWEGLKI